MSREAGRQNSRPAPAATAASDIKGVDARLESIELGKLIEAWRIFSIAAAAVIAPGDAQREVPLEEVSQDKEEEEKFLPCSVQVVLA